MALVHCPVGGRFPVRMSGEEGIRFWVTLVDGNDERLRVEVGNHEEDRRELTVGRDRIERFEVAGRAYSLLFPSTYVDGSKPTATGEAFLIVEHYPAKETKESTSRDGNPQGASL